MDPELHIVGLLVHARPGHCEQVAAAVNRLPQAAIRAAGGAGKLVVVAECASAAETLELIAHLRELPGVANVALVYQHAESLRAMDEVMEEDLSDEHHPSRIH